MLTTIDTRPPEDHAPVSDYLDDLEALVLVTPLERTFKRRFLELIDQLRAEIARHARTTDEHHEGTQ